MMKRKRRKTEEDPHVIFSPGQGAIGYDVIKQQMPGEPLVPQAVRAPMEGVPQT